MLFGLRLIEIQAVRANGYVEKANNELSKSATLLAPRGTIYDIDGIELARSISAMNIAVDQTVVNDPTAAANVVAPILGMSAADLLPDPVCVDCKKHFTRKMAPSGSSN
jgi:cell division protein FtsI (penicillin-binding protein 3)